MKKRTCRFGWTDSMTQLVITGKEIAKRDLRTGAAMVQRATDLHKDRVHTLNAQTSGGVQPLSRMHPGHPCRDNPFMFEVSATQKFVP